MHSRITGAPEEDEMEDNLNQVSSHLAVLKSQAIIMGSTVSDQNAQLDRMNTKVPQISKIRCIHKNKMQLTPIRKFP
jgi:hypothetical protein